MTKEPIYCWAEYCRRHISRQAHKEGIRFCTFHRCRKEGCRLQRGHEGEHD